MTSDEQTLELRDGRQLGWARCGATGGTPVLYLHGGLGSRLERQRTEQDYRRLGVDLITVDRPGHGLSSAHAQRTPQDFADDLVELLHQLRLDSVTVLGLSAGGLYALSLGERHPARVLRVGIVSGIGMVDRPGGMDELTPRFQRTYRNAREKPRVARAEMQLNIAAFRYRPAFAFGKLSDRRVTSDPDFQARFREALVEGARAGVGGFVSDIALTTGPWGFDPADVRVPVHWWHGERDSAVPLSQARYVVEHLPQGELTVVPGGGHFMIHTIIEDVLSRLLSAP